MRNNKKEVVRDLLAEHMQNEGASVRTNTVSRAVAQKVDRPQPQHTLDSSHPAWKAKGYHVAFIVNAVFLFIMGVVAIIAPIRMIDGRLLFGHSISVIPRLRTPFHEAVTMEFRFTPTVAAVYLLPIALLMAFFIFILIFTWRGIGTPKLLKRSAMMAVLMPVGYIAYDFLISLRLWTLLDIGDHWGIPSSLWFFYGWHLISVILFIFVCAAPFLCVFKNIRKHDNTLTPARALKFWK